VIPELRRSFWCGSVTILGVRTIEAEREEVAVDRPPLPKEADVTFDFQGTKQTVKLPAGATAWDQAQAAQKAFGMTLMCGPIEETADTYTVQVWKPSVYPVVFVKGEERVTSWVHNTKLKVAQEEARRLFGGRPTLELLSEPGLVYQVKTVPPRSQKRAIPESNTRQMTGPWIKPVVPPSVQHRRVTPAPPISQRSSEGRNMTATGADRAQGYRGVDIQVFLPQKKQRIKNVSLARDASRVQIAELIARQLRVDPLHSDFFEFAPDNWFETRELIARLRYDRPDLTKLDRVSFDQFRAGLDLTKPLFIETDGACSGNPGTGGWGFIAAQEDMKVEAYGAEGTTSNNEMELKAIDEALGFFRGVRVYAVIESDSEGCLAMMIRRGEQCEADNFIRLNWEAVKNRKLVESITTKLKAFNVQFRKVEGHKNDQWDDAADASVVRGRDDAISWPNCSFYMIIPERTITFRERAMRDYLTLAEVCAMLKEETEQRLPRYRDIKVFKGGNSYAGNKRPGHYQLVHKSLLVPIPESAAARPVAVKPKPAILRIWDEKN
jgi:ribonuclease HI